MPKNIYTEQLDTSGHKCPMPVLKARKALEAMGDGDILQVIATDPATVQDIPSYCSMSGHKLVYAFEEGGKYIFNILKAS